jgi:hypothetical protein
MCNITVPLTSSKSSQYSTDHPVPIFKIKYIGSPPSYTKYHHEDREILLKYPKQITFTPYQTQQLDFPIQIETSSLYCHTIIYGSDLLYRQGLTCEITKARTNDSFLSVKVHNLRNKTLKFLPFTLVFNCITVFGT